MFGLGKTLSDSESLFKSFTVVAKQTFAGMYTQKSLVVFPVPTYPLQSITKQAEEDISVPAKFNFCVHKFNCGSYSQKSDLGVPLFPSIPKPT